jgi:hypothetical protein
MSPLRSPHVAACVVALATVVVALGVPRTGDAAPRIPKIKTRIAKVQATVDGYVEIRRLHDTTSDCFPGETWVQTNRFAFATGRYVDVSLKRITGEGFPTVVTSPFSASGGRATIEGKTSDYRTTNYCDKAPGPVNPEPVCSKTSGRISISLQQGVDPTDTDDELVALGGIPLMIAIKRDGGGMDAPVCPGGGAARLVGKNTETAVLTTSIAPSVSVIVPSGYNVTQLMGIRPGKRFRKTILVSGPCSNPRLTVTSGGSPAPGNLNAHGDCFLTGKLAYTIRPRPADDRRR